jgi:hypothetical protein
MKKTLLIGLLMLLLVFLLVGCAKVSSPEPAQEPEVVAEPIVEDIEEPKTAEPEPEPEPKEPAAEPKPENKLKKYEDPDEGIFVIEADEPKDYFTFEGMKLRRTSRDKTEIKTVSFTLRNLEDKPFTPVVRMTFHGAWNKGVRSTVEQDFPLEEFQPGMKYVKTFPVSVYYHLIENQKKITLQFHKKHETPRVWYGTTEHKFVPIDELESLEIGWV